MIDEINPLPQSFRKARDTFVEDQTSNFYLQLKRERIKDARTYNLLTTDEVAALIVGDSRNMEIGRDIIVKKIYGSLEKGFMKHIQALFPFNILYCSFMEKMDFVQISFSTV